MTKKKTDSFFKPELPMQTIVILALLAIPRVVMHDLELVEFDSSIYKVAAFVPYIVWLAFAVFRKNKRPFQDFLLLGLVFGVFLALTHQLTWTAAWENPPQLGGNLSDLTPWVESLVIRIAAVFSSLMTGLFVGLFFGGVAYLAAYTRKK